MLAHRRPMLLLAVVVVAAVTMAALVTGGRETHVVVGGAALDRLVERLLVTLPGPGSGGYDHPRRDQADALARAYAAARSGDAARAARLTAPLGYGVRRLGEGDALALALAPRPRADDEPGHGWGLFVHAPAAPADLVVEVVHPRADVRTALLGLLAFRATEASDLLIAGAHRAANADGSADVAHAPTSAFQTVHRSLLHRGVTVLQLHGFDSRARSPDYGDAVVSDGTSLPSAPARAVARALRAAGLSVCLYSGKRCSQLAAVTNVQGQATRDAGGAFVHVELSARVRRERDLRGRVIGALSDALRTTSHG